MHGDSSESDAPVVELNVGSCRSSVAARTVFTLSSKNWRNVSASLDVGVIMLEVRLLRLSSVVSDEPPSVLILSDQYSFFFRSNNVICINSKIRKMTTSGPQKRKHALHYVTVICINSKGHIPLF